MPTLHATDLTVDVEGGVLVAHDLSPEAPAGAPVVLAVHGITANALAWIPVASALSARASDPVRFVAVDVRGRACSRSVAGPFGLARDVEDLRALADLLDGPPVLLGHSMGAFVSALAVARHPEEFAGAVLVDGGLGFAPPPDVDIDATLAAVIGPAMTRLSMTFEGEAAYLDYWAGHPAVGPLLQGPAGEDVRAYLLHDLTRRGEAWVSTCVLDAVRADGGDVFADPETLGAVERAAGNGVPLEFLWAERGLLDEPSGLYTAERLADLEVPDTVGVTAVEDVNHYSVIVDDRAVGQVVAAVERILSR